MADNPPPVPGQIFEVDHPFIREKFTEIDDEGTKQSQTWIPGVRFEPRGPGREDLEDIADGMGAQLITVVSTHRPGKFPTRVFYTRKWRDPDGKVFGKKSLRVISVGAFRTLTTAYRHHFKVSSDRSAG